MDNWPWDEPGQELLAVPERPGKWKRVVACLNVWDDIDELQANWDSWYPHVDHVIAVDGSYDGVPSTDGTLEFLSKYSNVTIIGLKWENQRHKRTAYLKAGKPGDLLFVIDADESVQSWPDHIPDLDIGWVTYTSHVYQRPQHTPRFVKWRKGLHYKGRHHWLMHGSEQLCTHQQGGIGYDHRLIPLTFHNSRGAKRTAARRDAVNVSRQVQVDEEFEVGEKILGHEPLRIFQAGPFDPGNVVYRLHTAINTTSPHTSAMVTGDLGPCVPPRQYEFDRDALILRDLGSSADVIHHHVMRVADKHLGLDLAGKMTVLHHHGTEFRRDPETWASRDQDITLRLVSNLELMQYAKGLAYLPNPVPVARYRALAVHKRVRGSFRIAHSPTKHALKGTAVFERVCKRLIETGLNIEPVIIHGKPLRESLEVKATCHAFFDSFFLGMQCSGLEAAAMGLPVIAGDVDCKREYEAWLGEVPYTYADGERQLEAAIERLYTDAEFYDIEATRVHRYVLTHHDYSAVVARYLTLLDEAYHWRQKLMLGNRVPA